MPSKIKIHWMKLTWVSGIGCGNTAFRGANSYSDSRVRCLADCQGLSNLPSLLMMNETISIMNSSVKTFLGVSKGGF